MKYVSYLHKKINANENAKTAIQTFKVSVIAIVLSLTVAGLLILICGFDPIDIYTRVFTLTLSSSKNIASALAQATPLMFSGIGFAIAFRSGIINLGLEGQMLIGAMASALFGAYFSISSASVHIGISLLAGAVAGGLVALLTGLLRVRFGAIELVTSIMFNEIIALITSYLSNDPLKAKSAIFGMTEKIRDTAILPKVMNNTQLTYAIFLAIILAIALNFLLSRTVLGYNMRTVGFNSRAAKVAGINVNRTYLTAFFISGAMAGLCGAVVILGVNMRFIDGFSDGFGWSGIAVAALANYSPVLTIISAILFGIIKAGAMILNRTTLIPVEFVFTIQALVVVFVAAPNMINRITNILRIPKLNKNIIGKNADAQQVVKQ